MDSLKPTLSNPEIASKKIRYWLLLMSASSCLMLARGAVQIEPGGLHFSRNTGNMAFWCSWLRKMTECWTDRSEALSNMRKFIGKYQISVCSGRFSSSFAVRKFFSPLEGGIPSKKGWIYILLLRERDIIGFMILALLLIAKGIMV